MQGSDMLLTRPVLTADQFEDLVARSRRNGARMVEVAVRRECPVCGAARRLYQRGIFSTGLALASGYLPAQGELLKNVYMECADCGFEQGS